MEAAQVLPIADIRDHRNKYGQSVKPISEKELRDRYIHLVSDPDEIVSKWGERIFENLPFFQFMRAHLYRNKLAYGGQVFVDVNEANNQVEEVGLPTWFPANLRMEPNHLRRITHSIAAELKDITAVIKASPKSSTIRDRRVAELADRYVRNFHESREQAKKRAFVALALPLYGTLVGKVTWDDSEWDTVVLPDGTRERAQVGKPRVDILAPSEVIVPLGDGFDDVSRLPWAVHRQHLTLAELQQRYPDDWEYMGTPDSSKLNENDPCWYWATASADPYYDLGLGINFGEDIALPFSTSPTFNTFPVDECFERCYDPAIGPYVYRTVICNGYLIEHGPYVPTDIDGNLITSPNGMRRTWDLPFRWVQYYTNPDSLFGYSMTRDALPIVWSLSWLYSVWLKCSVDSANKVVAQHVMDNTTPEYSHGMFRMKYLDKPPQALSWGGTPPTLNEAIQRIEGLLHDITLQPEVLMGAASPYQAAGAVEAQTAAAKSAFSPIRSNVNEFWAELTGLVLPIMRDMMTLPRLSTSTPELANSIPYFQEADFDGDDIRLDYEAYFNSTPAGREALADKRLASGLWDAETARRFLRSGPHDGGFNLEEAQERACDDAIASIVEAPDEQVDELYDEINNMLTMFEEAMNMAQQTGDQSLIPQFDPDAFMDDIMKQYGWEVTGAHDPAIHARQTVVFELQPPFQELSEGKKFFIRRRREVCEAQLAQQQAEQLQMQTIANHGVGQ